MSQEPHGRPAFPTEEAHQVPTSLPTDPEADGFSGANRSKDDEEAVPPVRSARPNRTASLGGVLFWGGAALLAGVAVLKIFPWPLGIQSYWNNVDALPVVSLAVLLGGFGAWLIVDSSKSGTTDGGAVLYAGPPINGVTFNESVFRDRVTVQFPEQSATDRAAELQRINRNTQLIQQQEELLIRMYQQGISQAAISFRISSAFAIIGAGILLIGAAAATTRGSDDATKYVQLITTLTGTVVSLISTLFIRQANTTRSTMVAQAKLLRDESEFDRRVNVSRELVSTIVEVQKRDELQGRIALSILNIKVMEGATGSADQSG